MKKEYLKVISDCDGMTLSAAIFEPEDKEEIRGVVQFSHGILSAYGISC